MASRKFKKLNKPKKFKKINKFNRLKRVGAALLLLSLSSTLAIRNIRGKAEKERKESGNSTYPFYVAAKTKNQSKLSGYLYYSERKHEPPFKEHFDFASRVTGVKKALLYAHAEKESHFKEKAKSNRNAFGIMQVTYGVYCDVERYSVKRYGMAIPAWGKVKFDPKWNIFVGAANIAQLHEELGFDAAILAYYAGASDTRKGIKQHGLENYIARLERSARPWRRKAEYYKAIKRNLDKYAYLDRLTK